jgi:hypothetical protein
MAAREMCGPCSAPNVAASEVDWFIDRSAYRERLDEFLSRAKVSVRVVAVTCKLSSRDGDLFGVIGRMLAASSSFRVCLSLLDPDCNSVHSLARSLGSDAHDLAIDLRENLDGWKRFCESLNREAALRFDLRTHDCLPLGSAYLVDVETPNGIIHVETRLHGAPKSESFGFRVAAPSEFFNRNRLAWMAILQSSLPLGGAKK